MKTKLQSSKLFKQVLSLALAIVMVLGLIPVTQAWAAEGDTTLYLQPNANWKEADARFAIYHWNDGGDRWTDMSDEDGDGIYEGTVPAGYSNIIFCRMNPGTTDNNWNNKWDQTSDLTVPTDGTNCYTVAEGAWSKGNGTWSTYTPATEPEQPAATYYVAGSEALCGSNWSNNDPANLMTLKDGLYEKVYNNVPVGYYEFKVTDGTWDNCWPGNNYQLTVAEESTVTITFNAASHEINVKVEPVEDNDEPEVPVEPEVPEEEVFVEPYIVAGFDTLCGSLWDPTDESNRMTLCADGLYEKVYTNVSAGTYEFKVTDGSWSNCWGDNGNNYVFTLESEQNVIILFNEETKAIEVKTADTGDFYTVAGTADLCGDGWKPELEANQMIHYGDGLYKKTFKSVPAGTHEFKVTDGSWGSSWGDNGNNYVFPITETSHVTIIFNAQTCEIDVEIVSLVVVEEPVDYDITIKVHYYRPDGDYSNWEVHMWNGVESLNSTRKFANKTVTHDGKEWKVATYYADASDTWVGFIVKTPSWTKDPDGDRHIDLSNVTGGTVNVYAVSGSALNDFTTDKSQAILGNKITAAVYDYKTSTIEITTSLAIEDEVTVDTFKLEGPDGQMSISAIEKIDNKNFKVTYEGTIDETNVYTMYYNDIPCVVTIPNVYSTSDFEAEYTYEGDDLGANWTAESTTFRLWAPTASAVSVNLYDAGDGGKNLGAYEMTPDVNGTWVATIGGDLNGIYYTYSVTRKGETVEAVDPYARTTGVNGNRAMIVDLDSTDPEGWENDTYVTVENYTDAVIWELHVRDFSIDETSGMTNKGKYLAFTEKGTTVPGTDISTGVDYMVDLGVNYVHLLPVYDINSVDETVGGYNWGYDPKNYNVPEGSYSTDPYKGAVRVTEFKQMVQSLHENGIGVIMDVVYNHVADANNFCFNQIVPGYFSRIHDDGSYQNNSGCGNDTATERSMVSKYIVDSVLYWAEEYHIDGFRWDLVGLIDYETINAVMEAVHEVNPDIIFYGEGWEMCGWTTKDEGEYENDPYSGKMTIQNNDKQVNTEAGTFAFFNDTVRNVIHGGVFTATDKGFVSGGLSEGTKQTVIDSYMANSVWGTANERVDTPLQTINYASCHDNYTLFDNLTVDVVDAKGQSLNAENAAAAAKQAAEMNNLAAAYYITAQGVPFIHAGEEMLRSKPTTDAEGNFAFDHNSYSSGDGVNSFKWGDLQNELNADTYEYYKGLIAFRAAQSALRMDSKDEIDMEAVTLAEFDDMVAVINRSGETEILSIFNASSTSDATVTLPEGEWNVYVNKEEAGTEVLETVSGTVSVESTSAMILVKVEEEVHEHDYEKVVTAPTCTEAGYTTYTCDCGDTYVADEVAALGHDYEAVVTAPTCTEAGYTTYTCDCGDTYVADEVAALGHDYVDGICGNCGGADPDYVPEGTEPSVPSTPVKPSNPLQNLIGKWLDKWFGGSNKPTVPPTEPEVPSEPTEPSVPSVPVKPSKPGFGGIVDWITGWWKR